MLKNFGPNIGDILKEQGLVGTPEPVVEVSDDLGMTVDESHLRFIGIRLSKVGATAIGKKLSVNASEWADGELLIGPKGDRYKIMSKVSFARGVKAHRFVLNPIRYDPEQGKILQPPSIVNGRKIQLSCPKCQWTTTVMDNRFEKMWPKDHELRCRHESADGQICGEVLNKFDLQNRFFVWDESYSYTYRKRFSEEKCAPEILNPIIGNPDELELVLDEMMDSWSGPVEDSNLLPKIMAVYRVPAVFDIDGKSSWTEEQLATATYTLPTDWVPADSMSQELEARMQAKRLLQQGFLWTPECGLPPWKDTMRPYKDHVRAGAKKCAGFTMTGQDIWRFGWVKEEDLLENNRQGFKTRFKKPDAVRQNNEDRQGKTVMAESITA